MTIRRDCLLPGNEAGLVSIIDEEGAGASALRERGRRHRRRLGIEDDEKGESFIVCS